MDACIASDAEPPPALGLERDHSDAPPYGQQELAFYHPYYQNHCYLPLCIFAGTAPALVTASLRPGIRPTGADKAMRLVRLLSYWRRHWPHTHMLVRGASHGAPPEGIAVLTACRWTAFVLGLAGHAVVLRHAAPTSEAARQLHHQRGAVAQAQGQAPPPRSRLDDACAAAAGSWAHPWRVGRKAEVRPAGDTPRFGVTSLAAPPLARRYAALSGARGQGENASKAVTRARRRDRTAAPTFLAPALRWLRACAAAVLHHAWRTSTFYQTALAQAQPSTISLTRCTIAVQVTPSKDRRRLHLPRAGPVQALLQRVPTWLYVVPLPVGNTS